MNWWRLLLLAVLGLIVAVLVAAFQTTPGYMDADAYYVVGHNLATGQGFTEPYLWNYLDNPAGIPHPSNSYWMPLASLIAAAGAALLGSGTWFAARAGFLLIAAALPPLAAALAWSFKPRPDLAFTSGLLAVFPAFYLPFLTVTDTFGLYMLLGGLFFLLVFRSTSGFKRSSFLITSLFLGIISGLMHLSRADGLLWLVMAITAILFVLPKPEQSRVPILLYSILLCLTGYLLIMGPWFFRNIRIFGTPLAPGGTKMLWLTSYDQLFAYPASQLTFNTWWHSGLAAILQARAWSLGLNLANSLAVQGEIFMLPLIGLGFWSLRKDRRVLLAGLAWLLTIGAMTVIFPFAGARGGFFHSGAALQLVWWALAPLGLERVIEWGRRKRGWNPTQAGNIFRLALVVLAGFLTAILVWSRVIGVGSNPSLQQNPPGQAAQGPAGYAWDQESIAYSKISQYLVAQGAAKGDIVMVANPPGFFLASGNISTAIPDGDVETLLAVAQKYNALYVVLEKGSVPAALLPVYDHPQGQADLIYLGELGQARIFLVRHH